MDLFSLNLLVRTPNNTYCSVAVPKLFHEIVFHRGSQVLRRLHMITRPRFPKVVGPLRPKLTLCKRQIK